nr:hypothetical protein [Rhodoferax sp.]
MLAMRRKVFESRWALPVVSLAMVGMLVLFYWIVNGATEAGELRRQAMAAQSSAVLQCNALPRWIDGKACIENIRAKGSAQEPTLFAAK